MYPPGGLVSDIAARDRIAHVFVAAVAKLLPAALAVAVGDASATVRRSELANALDAPIGALVEKLGDNTPKVREAAMHALLELALPSVLGAAAVAAALLRRPGKKQSSNTRDPLVKNTFASVSSRTGALLPERLVSGKLMWFRITIR